jgi:hypothetical protein
MSSIDGFLRNGQFGGSASTLGITVSNTNQSSKRLVSALCGEFELDDIGNSVRAVLQREKWSCNFLGEGDS